MRVSRRAARMAALALSLAAAGCVWDPYTNSYVPCCAYPYPYGYPYPAAASRPLPSGPGRIEPAPGPAIPAEPRLERRFAQANVTRDGMLTYQQAQAAGWHVVVRNFAAIDAGRKGYVTLDDIRAWFASNRPPPH